MITPAISVLGKLFVLMARHAIRATAFFRLPPERGVELGVQVEM
jgi:K+ transporter